MKNHIISKNRRLFAALASLAALIAGAAFVSCPSVNTEETVKYSITFDANGGKFSGDQDQITVISDTLRNVQAADFPDPQPTPPAQDLYFDNYYTGTDSGDIVSESTPLKPVSANFTVYARYTSSDSNLSADDAVALTKERLQIDAYMDYFYHEIILPSQGAEDTAISWTSNNAVYPVANGRVKVTDNTVFNGTITLTATISKGAIHDTKDFTVTIIDNNYYGYLLAYFNGNAVTQEQLRYALSTDGTDFVSLNDDNPVVLSATISTSGGIRDPHIVRGHDGKYYMVMTDMTSSRGWDSNRSIILLKSDDLLNWSASSVNISTRFSGFSTITHAWAPEIIYDRQKDKFLIYWSSNPNGGPDNIFYSWANSDFTDLTDDPVVLYPTSAPGVDPNSVIDGTLQNSGGKYRLFFKNQDGNFGTTNRICEATANTLTGQYGSARVNVTNDTVDGEGCETYRLIGTDTYVLAYDQYNNSTFGFFKSTDMASFTKASSSTNKTDGTHFVPRHGGFIPLTKAEYDFLAADRDWFAHAIPVVTANAALGLHYDFANVTGSTVQDSAGANNGTLTASGGVTPTIVAASNGMKYMDTNGGTADNAAGYLAIGSGAGSLITGQNDFTIAGYIYIENAATLTGNGWFLWCFSDTANAGQTVGNYVFLRPIDTRHTIGHGGYSNESNVSLGGTLSKNLWMHLMYRQQGMLGVLYMDGKPVAAASTLYNSTDLGSLSYGWLGRSCYSTDIMMKYTRYADFRIYPGAISDAQIAALDIPDTINVLNADQYTSDVSSAITTVTAMLGDLSAVSKDITLPVLNNGVTITWSSGNPAVLSNSGVVTRPPYAQGDATVTLTGTFTKGNASGTHDFTVTVLKQPGAAEMVATKITEAEIALGDLSTVDSNITLPASDAYVTVGWSSDNTAALSNTGAVTRQSNHTSLTLTGTFTSTADTSVSVKNTWPVRVMGIGASEEEFLNVHYEAVQGMGLQNTAESGNYYTPSLSGDAAAAANASAGINYIDIGSNGYINLGSKIGALIRKPEWTIEFYMRTTSDTGTMVSFANDNNISTTANTPWRGVFTFVNPNLTVKAYNHGRYGNAATNSTPSNSDYVATGNSGGLGSGHTNEWVHLMLIKSSDGGINIFRNGDCAQNARANDFSRLNTDAAFGAADADTDPLQFAYLGQSPFRNISASASDSDVQYVPHVYFYDFKMYSKALIPHNGTDQTTVDNYLKSDRVAVKSKLNSAFGYPDNQ